MNKLYDDDSSMSSNSDEFYNDYEFYDYRDEIGMISSKELDIELEKEAKQYFNNLEQEYNDKYKINKQYNNKSSYTYKPDIPKVEKYEIIPKVSTEAKGFNAPLPSNLDKLTHYDKINIYKIYVLRKMKPTINDHYYGYTTLKIKDELKKQFNKLKNNDNITNLKLLVDKYGVDNIRIKLIKTFYDTNDGFIKYMIDNIIF